MANSSYGRKWITNTNGRFKFLANSDSLILSNYVINNFLAKGSYSDVYSTFNTEENKDYVVKIFKNYPIYEEYAQKEILFLKKLSHDNIIKYNDHFTIQNHMFIVLEKFDCNLYEFYKLNDKFDYSFIIINLLKSLEYLNNNEIIHCDLKPENILIKADINKKIYSIVICDFNSAVYTSDLLEKNNNIVTLWYRPPEIYRFGFFDCKIDIWSLGCVIYEIFYKKPLFQAGINRNNLIQNRNLKNYHTKFFGYEFDNDLKDVYFCDKNDLNEYLKLFLNPVSNKRLSASQILKIPFNFI